MKTPAMGALCALLALGMSPAARADGIPGDRVAAQTTKVLQELPWARSLEDAKAAGQKEKKLVFWMQLVGDLDGGL